MLFINPTIIAVYQST